MVKAPGNEFRTCTQRYGSRVSMASARQFDKEFPESQPELFLTPIREGQPFHAVAGIGGTGLARGQVRHAKGDRWRGVIPVRPLGGVRGWRRSLPAPLRAFPGVLGIISEVRKKRGK